MSTSTRAIAAAGLGATALLVALTCCTSSIKRLDEAVLLETPALKLKVVRYYENLPWHYSGEIYQVHCSTPQTRGVGLYTTTEEPGWVQIERGGATGSKNAAEIAARIRDTYRIVDGYALVIVDHRFMASLDGCRTFVHWNGWDLAEDLVHQAPKPPHCNEVRPACPWENFSGDRSLHFSEVKVEPRIGRISMLVDSTAFKNNKRMAVSSADGGNTWTVVPVDKESAEQSHAGDAQNARA